MARKRGTIKTFIDLWIAHEKLYFSIFFEALQQLEINEDQRKDEDAISEALCPVLRGVCYKHKDEVMTPSWEKPKQPVNINELRGGKIRKRPDFTCSFLNSLADSPETYEISFDIECKRLGGKKGSWDLNQNYIDNGIKRFDSSDHEYGKRAPSGMMIGYIVDMEESAILKDVNKYLSKTMPELNFKFADKVVSYAQCFNRKHIRPIEFKLLHLWADLK
jgi:hypothetical protein